MQTKYREGNVELPAIALLVRSMPSLQGMPLQMGKIMLTCGSVSRDASNLSVDAVCCHSNIEWEWVVSYGEFSSVCVL